MDAEEKPLPRLVIIEVPEDWEKLSLSAPDKFVAGELHTIRRMWTSGGGDKEAVRMIGEMADSVREVDLNAMVLPETGDETNAGVSRVHNLALRTVAGREG